MGSLGQATSICRSFCRNPQTLSGEKKPCSLVAEPSSPSPHEGPLLPVLSWVCPPSRGSHGDTVLQFIKPYIHTQVTMTWRWAQGLTLPFPTEHLPEQAGFSSGSHHTQHVQPQSPGQGWHF